MTSLRAVPACLLFALAAVACASGGAGAGSITTEYGFNVRTIDQGERETAPAVEGETVRPGRVDEATFEGKVLRVVNFWGSWCGPCRREQPFLETLSREYASRGVVFVGVNSRRDPRPNANAFLDEFEVTYPSIYDPGSTIAFRFSVRVMPATYFIDRNGGIAAVAIGAFRSEANVRRLLDDLLAEVQL